MNPNDPVTQMHLFGKDALGTLLAIAGKKLCPRCRCCELIWIECEYCEDGFSGHDCGEDCCSCADPEDNVICDVCEGKGGWYACLGKCDENGRHKKIKPDVRLNPTSR